MPLCLCVKKKMHTEAQGHSRVNIVTGVCIKLVTLFSKSFDKNSSKNRASVPLCEKKLHTEAQGHSFLGEPFEEKRN